MVNPQVRFEALEDRLREQGYRLTPQRIALLRLLAASDRHPSASDLYDQLQAQFPTTSRATIYKTLNLLKELDEVLELGFSDDDNRYDGSRPYAHPHLICVCCRKIIDPEVGMAEDVVQQTAQQVARQSGYQSVSHRLDFYGVCPDCQRERQAQDRPNTGRGDE